MRGNRTRRVEELLRNCLGEIVINKVQDPRVGFVTVTSVSVTTDLKKAWVNISVLGEEKQKKSTIAALKRAHGFIQREVAKELKLRYTPTLEFRLDDKLDESLRIQSVLSKLKEEGQLGKDDDA